MIVSLSRTEPGALCCLCSHSVQLADATVMAAYPGGEPALAHERHRGDQLQWIQGWANFLLMHHGAGPDNLPDERATPSAQHLYIEHRPAKGPTALTADVAQHLQTRSAAGRVVVVADNPYGFHSALRKNWVALSRRLERERAKLLGDSRRGLTLTLNDMYARRFGSTAGVQDADVLIVRPDEPPEVADDCKTLYICCEAGPDAFAPMFDRLPQDAVVVVSRASRK